MKQIHIRFYQLMSFTAAEELRKLLAKYLVDNMKIPLSDFEIKVFDRA